MLVKVCINLFALIILVSELKCAVVHNKTMTQVPEGKNPSEKSEESSLDENLSNSTKAHQDIKIIKISQKTLLLLVPKQDETIEAKNQTAITKPKGAPKAGEPSSNGNGGDDKEVSTTSAVKATTKMPKGAPKSGEPSSNGNGGDDKEVSTTSAVKATTKMPKGAPKSGEPSSNGNGGSFPTPAKPIIVTASPSSLPSNAKPSTESIKINFFHINQK